jgi:ATP-binding cassette subfamily B (MDR/TAP) protein 1
MFTDGLSDEATSALDATSRLLVFEAIKKWRKNKTTIVITHDLTQITSDDFVFVMRDGMNVEAGYRGDLEEMKTGIFTEMARSQGSVPERDLDEELAEKERQVQAILDAQEEDEREIPEAPLASHRPVTFGNWMFEVVTDLTKVRPQTMQPPPHVPVPEHFNTAPTQRRPSTVYIPTPGFPVPAPTANNNRRLSLQLSPTSPVFSFQREPSVYIVDDDDFDLEKAALHETASHAKRQRVVKRNIPEATELTTIRVEDKEATSELTPDLTFWQLIREIYPTVPHKFFTILGLLIAIASGAITPVFSFILSHLFVQVSNGAKDVSTINKFGGLVLALAALDGLLIGLKYFILEKVAMSWVTSIRDRCYNLILLQDKKWFDKLDGQNGPARMVQVLIKDGDDARTLIATVFPQMLVVVAMFGTGMLWAMIRGWQLTLVGFAIAPVFVVTMAIQNHLVSKCEFRNKRAREQVAKEYYEVRGLLSFVSFFFLLVSRRSPTFVPSARWPLKSSSNSRSKRLFAALTHPESRALSWKVALTVSLVPSSTSPRRFYSTSAQSSSFEEPTPTCKW